MSPRRFRDQLRYPSRPRRGRGLCQAAPSAAGESTGRRPARSLTGTSRGPDQRHGLRRRYTAYRFQVPWTPSRDRDGLLIFNQNLKRLEMGHRASGVTTHVAPLACVRLKTVTAKNLKMTYIQDIDIEAIPSSCPGRGNGNDDDDI